MSKRLQQALLRKARAWAGQITSLAKSYAPKHLRPYIKSRVEEKKDGSLKITTTVDMNANPTGPGHPNYGSSDARAQEYGSGIRARRGSRTKYLIHPVNAPFLEFQGTNQFDGWLIRTKEVKHPGIQAANQGKGYIGPAWKDIRKRAKAEMTKEVREAILGDLRAAFGKK